MKTKLLVTLAGALALGSCAKKKEVSCKQAAEHFGDLLRTELTKETDSERREVGEANVPALQSAIRTACEEDSWSVSTRQCMFEAKSAADMEECEPEKSSSEEASASPETLAP